MMKNRHLCLTLSLFFTLLSLYTQSQEEVSEYGKDEKTCGSHLDRSQLKKVISNEALVENRILFAKWIKELQLPQRWSPKYLYMVKTRNANTREIPIAFHLIASQEDGTLGKLLNKARIASTIYELNERYANANLSFCLATKYKTDMNEIKSLKTLPNYNPQFKVFTYPDLFNSYVHPGDNLTTYEEVNLNIKEVTSIDNKHLLNIWVTDRDMFGPFIMNHASFPDFRQVENGLPGLVGYSDDVDLHQSPFFSPNIWAQDPRHDGILIHTPNFGSLSPRATQYLNDHGFDTSNFNWSSLPGISPRNSEGAILAHEVGHFFSLFHTWGDSLGCVDGFHGDFVYATPLEWGPSYTACEPDNGPLAIEHLDSDNHPKVCNDYYQPPLSSEEYKEAKLVIAQNIMSYANDSCKRENNFVHEQVDRIKVSLKHAPNRLHLGVDDEDNSSDDLSESIFCQNDPLSGKELYQQINLEATLYPVPVHFNNSLTLSIGNLSDDLTLTAYHISNVNGQLISGSENLAHEFKQSFQFTAPHSSGHFFAEFIFTENQSGEVVVLTKPFIVY